MTGRSRAPGLPGIRGRPDAPRAPSPLAAAGGQMGQREDAQPARQGRSLRLRCDEADDLVECPAFAPAHLVQDLPHHRFELNGDVPVADPQTACLHGPSLVQRLEYLHEMPGHVAVRGNGRNRTGLGCTHRNASRGGVGGRSSEASAASLMPSAILPAHVLFGI
jgi:hypothetical protein